MKDTNSSGEQKKLFTDFPPVPTSVWEEKIREDLKGADYDQKLLWNTGQGFSARPYYREEDLLELKHLEILPGEFPFVRGNAKEDNSWLIRQDIPVEDIPAANARALDILMKGVDSIGFVLDEDHSYTCQELDRLFKNIFAESLEINFVCGKASSDIVTIILELVRRYNRSLDKIRGSVDYDPLGELIRTGSCSPSPDAAFDTGKQLIENAAYLPNFQVITFHGDLFKNAGASIVQEIGFSLSAGVEYLTQLTERKLSINRVAPRIRFQFAIGPDYFMEMARLRAARFLWSAIVKAYGPSQDQVCKMNIHTVTSRWNLTLYDPYVNLLRSATESMSAILAGTSSHAVMAYDSASGSPNDTSERIARNQQLLLKEESYLDRVIDPSAGSYYIEKLTRMLSEQAWDLFLRVEEKGGFLQAFKEGFIQEQVHSHSLSRDLALAQRKEILIGTNQYPHFQESIRNEIDDQELEPVFQKRNDAIAEPLRSYRGSMAFEQIRYATDQFARNAKRPVVFMLTYGNLTMRRARAQFAINFFACAGFEALDNLGFATLEDGVADAIKSKAEIVVFCSSDEEYAQIGGEVVLALQRHAIPVLAGYPKELVEKLKEQGIRHFIHVRSNILETLREFQKVLRIG
ncbi:MAG TPA: methylmalonyl-CoA mutase family protein [Bacteroidales bacterium]|nr:methylmalonyl-CoA mutase family protein [Bacteroidales bacterium]HNS47059.1 methylmalonyl-CoA mutase family protein [Bacteroidales bacterium]